MSVKILKEHFRYQQFDWDCGIACYIMTILALGIPEPEFNEASEELSTTADEGTSTHSLERALRRLCSEISGVEFRSGEDCSIDLLAALVGDGWIVTVCFREPDNGIGHLAIVQAVGDDSLTLANPESGPNNIIAIKDFVWRTGFERPERRGWYAAVRRQCGIVG